MKIHSLSYHTQQAKIGTHGLRNLRFLPMLILVAILLASCGTNGIVLAPSEVDKGSENTSSTVPSSTGLVEYGVLLDARDGQSYRTVTIGTQTWMADNLNYEPTTGSYCYDDAPANCDIYGRLYTWDAAMGGSESSETIPSDVQGVCPDGWHLPSDGEWGMLAEYVATETGLTDRRTGTFEIAMKLKSTSGWSYYSEEVIPDNAYGFSGLPGGVKNDPGSRIPYEHLGTAAYWWSTGGVSTWGGWWGFFEVYNNFISATLNKAHAISVRCLQGDGIAPFTNAVSFDSDGGSSVEALNLVAGASITPPAEPTKAGHTFAGWSPALPATMPSADLTVTAQWEFVIVAGTFTDTRDGQEYSTVTIGDQTWMAENLNYDAGAGSYCYDDDSANCVTYGRLYTWEAAMGGASSSNTTPSGVQGVCPVGWHLPSDGEWTILSDYVIANSAGTSTSDIGPYLKSTTGWNTYYGITSDDNFGFSGLPGGYRKDDGSYGYVGNLGYWWSSTESSNSFAYRWFLNFSYNVFLRYGNDKSFAFSVRCVISSSTIAR